jgi:hypothetical protein
MLAEQAYAGLTLVIPDKADEERDAVAAAWADGGGTVLRLGKFWQPPAIEAERVRIYGPTTFATVLRELWPIELVAPSDDLILQVPALLLQRKIWTSPLAEMVHAAYPLFAKPQMPKLFRAGVYLDWATLAHETRGLAADVAVTCSEVVSFVSEVRAFCVNGRVLTCAAYEGTDVELAAAAQFVESILVSVACTLPIVVDVGQLSTGEWALVEFNEAWGAGLNGNDAAAAAKVIACATQALRR